MPNTPEACEPFEADLSALIDGELSSDRDAAVRAHVAACPHCDARLRALCDVDLALAAAPVPAVSDALRARLADRIARDGTAAAPAREAIARPAGEAIAAPRRRRWLATPARVAVAAAAAAAVLYLAVVGRDPNLSPPPTPRVAISQPTPATPSDAPSARPPAPVPAPSAGLEAGSQLAVAPTESRDDEALAAASEEDLAVLLELETVESLDLIANLDLLERWLNADDGAAG